MPDFFVSVVGIGNKVRPQARLRCVSWGERAPVALCREPTEAAAETKSFCPCHKTGENTGFSPVFFLHVLYGYGVHAGSDSGFSHPFAPILTQALPLQHPKHTRLCLFRLNPGAFFSFLLVHGRKIFGFVFVQVAICWLQIEVIGDSIQPGHVLLDIVQLRYLRGGVAQQFENLA